MTNGSQQILTQLLSLLLSSLSLFALLLSLLFVTSIRLNHGMLHNSQAAEVVCDFNPSSLTFDTVIGSFRMAASHVLRCASTNPILPAAAVYVYSRQKGTIPHDGSCQIPG